MNKSCWLIGVIVAFSTPAVLTADQPNPKSQPPVPKPVLPSSRTAVPKQPAADLPFPRLMVSGSPATTVVLAAKDGIVLKRR